MKERGIIFNADMVRAILDGRKTQTRRIMKPQPTPCDYIDWRGNARGGHVWPSNIFRTMLHVEGELQNGDGGWKGLVGDACPFGDIDDRLWVREAFQVGLCTESTIAYKATHKPSDLEEGWHEKIKWRPSIHMPRWASRILLEITGVRVERLQDINEEDAVAEGVAPLHGGYWKHYQPDWTQHQLSARGSFVTLWNSINGVDAWYKNPWVWVIEFRRVTP
ncbi:hypothetical protein ABM016_05960 [Morganella morganii]|uniref:hypothetical protein n=1 Tax=Morganella morganii TaxID=582 RepID=UPI003EBA304D